MKAFKVMWTSLCSRVCFSENFALHTDPWFFWTNLSLDVLYHRGRQMVPEEAEHERLSFLMAPQENLRLVAQAIHPEAAIAHGDVRG